MHNLTTPVSVEVHVKDTFDGGKFRPVLRRFDDATKEWVDALPSCDWLGGSASKRTFEGGVLTTNVCHFSQFAVFLESTSNTPSPLSAGARVILPSGPLSTTSQVAAATLVVSTAALSSTVCLLCLSDFGGSGLCAVLAGG